MEEIKFKDIWATLSKVDCSDHVEKKTTGSATLKYLTWSWAWAELMRHYPDATYEVREWEGRPWLCDPVAGVMVMTTVSVGGNSRTMWMSVMDGANNALKDKPYVIRVRGYNGQPVEKMIAAVDMCAINRAIMRCLVKNMAMFGLGLNLYSGDDIPVGADAAPAVAASPKPTAARPVAPAPTADTAAKPSAQVQRRRAPSRKAVEAWRAYKALPSVAAMSEGDRSKAWTKMLQETCGKTDATALADEDWDGVLMLIMTGGAE